MSKKHSDPIARLWHWALLIFGAAILLTLTVSLLSKILIWLIIAAAVSIAIVILIRLNARRDR